MVALLGLSACTNGGYQKAGFSGGYTDARLTPDSAAVSYTMSAGNSPMRVFQMAMLRCAELTNRSGYRYFTLTGWRDISFTRNLAVPGYAQTNVVGGFSGSTYGNNFGGSAWANAETTWRPPSNLGFYNPGVQLAIRMGNDSNALSKASGRRAFAALEYEAFMRDQLRLKQ